MLEPMTMHGAPSCLFACEHNGAGAISLLGGENSGGARRFSDDASFPHQRLGRYRYRCYLCCHRYSLYCRRRRTRRGPTRATITTGYLTRWGGEEC